MESKQKRIDEIQNTLAAYRNGWVGIPTEDLQSLVNELIGLLTDAKEKV